MAKKMKAAVVDKFGKHLIIEELPVPEAKEGQAVVKIEASGGGSHRPARRGRLARENPLCRLSLVTRSICFANPPAKDPNLRRGIDAFRRTLALARSPWHRLHLARMLLRLG